MRSSPRRSPTLSPATSPIRRPEPARRVIRTRRWTDAPANRPGQLSVIRDHFQQLVDPRKAEAGEAIRVGHALGGEPSREGANGPQVAAHGDAGQGGRLILEAPNVSAVERVEVLGTYHPGEALEGCLVVADRGRPEPSPIAVAKVVVDDPSECRFRRHAGPSIRRREVSVPENIGCRTRNEAGLRHDQEVCRSLERANLSVKRRLETLLRGRTDV